MRFDVGAQIGNGKMLASYLVDSGFLPTDFDRSIMFVRSENEDRIIQSAQGLLLGMRSCCFLVLSMPHSDLMAAMLWRGSYHFCDVITVMCYCYYHYHLLCVMITFAISRLVLISSIYPT